MRLRSEKAASEVVVCPAMYKRSSQGSGFTAEGRFGRVTFDRGETPPLARRGFFLAGADFFFIGELYPLHFARLPALRRGETVRDDLIGY